MLLQSTHVCWMMIGACNPMVWPIRIFQVVQLGWRDGLLLVSTIHRVVVLNTNTQTSVNVGTKPRDGLYGGSFGTGPDGGAALYCARPGSRVWSANPADGSVAGTMNIKKLFDCDSKVRQLRLFLGDHFRSMYPPCITHMPCDTLYCVPFAYWMLIGACDPMLCPIHVFRSSSAPASPRRCLPRARSHRCSSGCSRAKTRSCSPCPRTSLRWLTRTKVGCWSGTPTLCTIKSTSV